MANEEHLAILRQGVAAWNAWREKDWVVMPDLSGTDLSGTDLSGANLRATHLEGANLSEADLRKAYLREAYFSEANLSGASLSEANLSGASLSEASLSEANLSGAYLREAYFNGADLRGADLRGADLRGAYFSEANLSGADLSGADLRGAHLLKADLSAATLIDAYLDGADLTGAKLWETQRTGWSMNNVICRFAFWDRKGEEPTKYEEGEFERIFAEKPRIILRYPGGMSPIDLVALPIVVQRLQAEHPGSLLQVRSVQNDGGGASVTITVEDRAGRDSKAFEQELVCIQTKLEQAFEERDYLRGLVKDALTKIAESPRQEIHYHRPRGRIEGPIVSRDTYNFRDAGAVGPGAHAHDNVFIQGGIDLPKLAEELGRLHAAMKGEATGTREQDKATVAVADAEEAALKGDGPAALQYLQSAGKWTLGIAEKIGVSVAIEALKKAM
jgi:hypothetical protein